MAKKKLQRLQIDLEGRISHYGRKNVKNVNAIPVGIPMRVFAPEQGKNKMLVSKPEFMRRLLEQAPEGADAYTLSESREAENLFPSFDLRYGMF